MKLDEFQEKVKIALLRKIEVDLDLEQKSEQILKAFTGAGKTVILGELIRSISELEDQSLCFMWITPGKGNLDDQSYKSLKQQLSSFRVSMLSNFNKSSIDINEIIVLNWELVSRKTNILRRDGEKYSFTDIIENTKLNGIKIVLLVDESHRNMSAQKSSEVVDIIGPDIIIEASATPIKTPTVTCPYDKGRKAGIVKKYAIINKDISDDENEDEFASILTAALKTHSKVKVEYVIENLGMPLLLVNVENSKGGEDGAEIKVVEEFLAKQNITVVNGKLAIWTDKIKENIDNLINPYTSKVEVLIFKQAITEGWDCPRACILVELRQGMCETFRDQVAGRILRMPNRRHYDNYWIDNAFIYTNDRQFVIEQDIDGPLAVEVKSDPKNGFSISLNSEYKKQDWNDIQVEDGKFRELFWDIMEEQV